MYHSEEAGNTKNILSTLENFYELNFVVQTSAGSILTEIEKSTILKQFFRIEIEPKSIFINLQNRQKTEIGKKLTFLTPNLIEIEL